VTDAASGDAIDLKTKEMYAHILEETRKFRTLQLIPDETRFEIEFGNPGGLQTTGGCLHCRNHCNWWPD
jgi:hypothetical protein